jgi:serine/threonine protein phosphatase PrpC
MRFFDLWRPKSPRSAAPPVAEPASVGPGRLRFAGAMLSDIGQVRRSNQDAVIYFTGSEAEQDTFDFVAAVADGMGGHAAGEVASAIAVATLRDSLKDTRSAAPEALSVAFEKANRAIRDHSAAHPETQGMGTTCTAVVVRGDKMWIGHIGDTRAYLFREGALTQLSEDHTLNAQLIRDGTIAAEDAAASQNAGLLLRALGAAEGVEPMLSQNGLPLQADDRLLLCSDGLHGVVASEALLAAMQIADPHQACEALLQAAIAQGGPDNISAGVFHFYEPDETGAKSGAPTRHDGLAAAAPD